MSMPRLKNDTPQKGQATVEFALAAVIFFTAFLAIVEFAHLFYVKLTLQHALREAGRYMVTGRADVPVDSSDPDGAKLPRCNPDELDSVESIFYKNIKGFGTSPTFTVDPPDCGVGEGSVTLTATYLKPWFSVLANNKFLPGGVPLSVSMTWINEPFPPPSG